jgi:hypothetical protein
MELKSARRLRILGLCVLALFFLVAFPATTLVGTLEEPYKNALSTTLAIGIGLLLLAEIGPMIRSLKAGGVEVQFGDSVSNKFNEFERRLLNLELAVEKSAPAGKKVQGVEQKPPPGIRRRRRRSNDPWKGRFGGKATSKGFKLSAEFKNDGQSSAQVVLTVTAPADRRQDLECLDFYLHDSFDPDIVPAVFRNGKAELDLLTTGGFTVGAWIPCAEAELELDLAELPNAPRIIREN